MFKLQRGFLMLSLCKGKEGNVFILRFFWAKTFALAKPSANIMTSAMSSLSGTLMATSAKALKQLS